MVARAAVRTSAVAAGWIFVFLASPPTASAPANRQPSSDASSFVDRFKQQFAVALLDEDCRQTEFKAPAGVTLNTGAVALPPPQSLARHIRSEILVLWRGDEGWLVRRRVLSIDGKAAPSAAATGFDVLASAGLERLVASAAAFNPPAPLLKISVSLPVFDFPIWPIALLDSAERARLGLTAGSTSRSARRVKLNLKRGDLDISVSFELDRDGQVAEAEVGAHLPKAVGSLRAEFETNRELQISVPRKISETYQHGFETATTEIVYSNLRRYNNAGSLLQVPPTPPSP